MTATRGGPGPAPEGGGPPERWHTGAGARVVDVADWTATPRGASRSWFDAPSGRLATLSMGPEEGESVLLVPGLTGSKEDFSLVLPGLAHAGLRALSYDLAGQYESAEAGPEHLVPPRARYDYDLFVDDLIALLESRGGPSHVLGYSFAGIVAQLALVRRPELFSSLTLMSCPPRPGPGFRDVPVVGRFSVVASSRVNAAIVVWALRRNVARVPRSRIRFVRQRFGLTRRRSVTDAFELMQHTPDVRGILATARLPKLVAVGEHDIWPLELHRRFAAEIGARLSVYPGGHSPCETSPLELTEDLLQLIRGA
ncbi:alpha/beta hydrolase [Agrococcus sp. BE272]|uniref:alpha/beta fold hydrolase n=2 Tax=unclassified Agrococcus TaxID=2615065 RepID=UPI002862B057|nr:alpha/beta hydrolase [Agrococcus sp. BE272]MDR7235150.1 pimeloyl-ACP methyl ester carboxylesterase [Agrococcus sp. BE272]